MVIDLMLSNGKKDINESKINNESNDIKEDKKNYLTLCRLVSMSKEICELGRYLNKLNKKDSGIKCLEMCADVLDDAGAMVALSELTDSVQTKYHYLKMAADKKNNVDAMYRLGMLYKDNKDNKDDLEDDNTLDLAINYFKLATKNGDIRSELYLAECYRRKKDYRSAVRYYAHYVRITKDPEVMVLLGNIILKLWSDGEESSLSDLYIAINYYKEALINKNSVPGDLIKILLCLGVDVDEMVSLIKYSLKNNTIELNICKELHPLVLAYIDLEVVDDGLTINGIDDNREALIMRGRYENQAKTMTCPVCSTEDARCIPYDCATHYSCIKCYIDTMVGEKRCPDCKMNQIMSEEYEVVDHEKIGDVLASIDI